MAHWNHRVFKKSSTIPLIPSVDWFTIREVYYNDNGDIVAYGNPTTVQGDSIESLRQTLEWMLKSLDTPILVESDVVLVDDDEIEMYDYLDGDDTDVEDLGLRCHE